MATGLSFDGNSLQTANILTREIDHFSLPNKTAQLFTIAHENKSSIPFTSYPTKMIVVTGVVIDTSIAALDARLDTFRSYFLNQDKNLDIDYNGSTRRYTATLDAANSKIERPGGLLYAQFTLQFICTSPFGQDVTATVPSASFSPSATGRTSSAYTDAVTFIGTAPYQLPVVTITLTAVSSSGLQYIFWGNNGNGQGIYIQRSTWSNGDVVVIDVLNKAVTVNGVATAFTGAFPEFPPGAQSLGYTDSFTSRTFTINVSYNALYL